MIIEDHRKIAILNFVKENAGTSLRAIIEDECVRKEGARVTIQKTVPELETDGFLQLKKAERQGKADQYFITDKGLEALRISPMGSITKKGLITIGFSKDFLKHLGSEESAQRFVSMLNNPEEGPKIADLIGSQIAFYVENMIHEPRFAAENIETLKRIFFVGSLPETVSATMTKAIKGGVFNDENAAFGYIISNGISVLNSAVVGGLRPDPSRGTVTIVTSRFDPSKGVYISGRDIARRNIEAMTPEQAKEWLLERLSYSS